MRYHNTTEGVDEQEDLVGSPTLDRPIRLTRFPTMGASRKKELRVSLNQLADLIENTEAADKAMLPWFKMGIFGSERTDKGSLRSNDNMVSATGCELDFDDCRYTPLEARHRLRKAGLCFLLYTTPQHKWEGRGNRFRVFLPFSEPLPPETRERMVARVNGVLGGLADPASFTMSQSFYAGNVTGRQKVKIYLSEGRYLDTASDLDAGAKWKTGRTKTANDNEFDETAYLDAIANSENYHSSAIALAGKWASDGVPYVETMQRLRAAFDRVPEEARDARWKERVADLPVVLAYVYGEQVKADFAERDRQEHAFDDIPTAEEQAEIDAAFDELVGGRAKPDSGSHSDGLTFLKPSECAAAESRRYVIKGLVAEGDVACIVGAPGVGKSLLAPRLGYAVAQGEGIFGMRVRQGGVWYVAAEDQHGMRGRVAALRREHGEADDFELVCGVSDLLTKGSEHPKRLREAVKQRRPSLIIIDTLALAFPGLEENSAEGMGRVVAVAQSLTKWGAAVVLIHHDTKDGQQGLPRGHSLLNGALDVSLHLTKDDGIVRAKLTKNRNGTTERDIAFTIGTQTLGLDDDGDSLTAAVCRELDPADAPQRESRLTPSARAAFEIIGELLQGREAVPEEEWRKACVDSRTVSASDKTDSRAKTFKRAAEELLRKRRVAFHDGFYSVTGIAGKESFASESHNGEDDSGGLV